MLLAPKLASGASPARDTPADWAQSVRSQADNERLYRAVARMYDLDPALLAAIAQIESGGNAGAVSSKGAEGMMQLMPATANRFGVADPFDPVSNVLGAARFLAYLRAYRPEMGALTLPEILAAYNAGEGAVGKYRGVPPYLETRDYVRRVLIAYLLANDNGPLARKLRLRSARPSRETPTSANPQNESRSDGANKILDRLEAIKRERALAESRAPRAVSESPVGAGLDARRAAMSVREQGAIK